MFITTGLPIVVGVITLFTVLYIHILIERVFHRDESLHILHFPNVMFTALLFAVTSITINGFLLNGVLDNGWKPVLINGFLLPFPVIIIVYCIVAPIFRNALKRYVTVKGSNIVYLKKRLIKNENTE
ncbi:hypothetical protein [Alteribacter populi]|uniref:hypothetical protein n=1 Tax=Alteribacter populi TaxID=2011011 RepID=UPI000BBA6F41|nr:hypothetical protein [Alteribacter populi]